MKLKFDLHVHSYYSKDGFETVHEIILEAKRKGLDGIALTDHNTINGIKEAKKIGIKNDIIVIAGCEIKSMYGDILAYGVTDVIKKCMSVAETIYAIHENGGIAVAAHPYPEISHRTKMYQFLNLGFDAIETKNARSLLMNNISRKKAEKLKIPQTGGSDAHSLREIGNAYTEINSKDKTEKSVLDAIKRGKTTPRLVKNTSIYSFIYCTIKRILK